MEQYEDFIVNEQNKHMPNSGKEYTVINSPLYTANNDKILYASDINWQDVTARTDTGQTSTPFNSTTDVLNFIASQFNLMSEEIIALDNRIKELENNKQATVVSAKIIKQDDIHDGKILYIGESVEFPKPKVQLTFSDGSTEYVTTNVTLKIKNLSLQGATFKEGSDSGTSGEQSDDQVPTDETTASVKKISSINYHNYIKHNHTGVNVFFGGVNGADIFNDYSSKDSRHPLSYLSSTYITNDIDPDANGTYPYRILDKYYHGVGQSGLSGPEFIYSYTSVDDGSANSIITFNTNIDNNFKINVTSAVDYSYLASFKINAEYYDVNTNSYITTTNELDYNNILFAPKKNITIDILGSKYNLPVKAACHAKGNKTLGGQYDITKLTGNNEYLSEIFNYSYFDTNDGNHVIYGFTMTSQEGDPKTLSDVFAYQELPIDYIKLPDNMWYKKSYIGDNTNWQNRPNSYYAYFDANTYSNPTYIYAYTGNRIIFNYSPNMANAFNGMPQYSYTYIDKDRSFNLPTVSGSYNGYTFEGWYTDSSYTGEGMTNTYKPTENITLYAKFVEESQPEEYYWYAGTTQIDDTNYNDTNIVSQVTSIPSETTISTNDEYLYIVVPKEKVITVYDENNFEVNMKTYNSSTHSFTNATTYVDDNYAIYRSAQKGVGTSRIVVSQ